MEPGKAGGRRGTCGGQGDGSRGGKRRGQDELQRFPSCTRWLNLFDGRWNFGMSRSIAKPTLIRTNVIRSEYRMLIPVVGSAPKLGQSSVGPFL
jgi:hypothetical protein